MSVEVVELSPLKASAFRWLPHRGGPVVTVVCKATFALAPGVATLAVAQDDVNQRDLHAGNDARKGLYSASDMAPYKRHADVTLVGRCYAPPGELAKMLIARLQVGSMNKCIEVRADRYFGPDGTLYDDNFFSKMALGYERAAGGANSHNPVGVDVFSVADDNGRTAAPNLQQPGVPLVRDAARPPVAVGFGPIAAAWPTRRELLTEAGRAWLTQDWTQQRMPERWNWRYFNVAPADQRCDELADDVTIELEHLHPEHAHLSMQLPGVRPCVFVEGAGARGRQLLMRADTLWIDTNRLVATLCWRGQVELSPEAEAVRALVAMCAAGESLTYSQVLAMHAKEAHSTRAQSPPSSSNPLDSEKKTRVRAAAAGSSAAAASSFRTSPVPLVPSSDCAPPWLPPVSSRRGEATEAATSSLEIPLTAAEITQVRQLAAALSCSPQQALRQALAAFHRTHFSAGG